MIISGLLKKIKGCDFSHLLNGVQNIIATKFNPIENHKLFGGGGGGGNCFDVLSFVSQYSI